MNEVNLSCPVPRPADDFVLLAHGGGGKLTNQLIERIFLPAFSCAPLETRHDGASLNVNGQRLAFTTDSYVVRPLVFPGGDIGRPGGERHGQRPGHVRRAPALLECGLHPRGRACRWRRCARWWKRMRVAAASAGVQLVTGDTKVVDKGKGDGVFINTAGIGVIEARTEISPAAVRAGDAILVSGDLGAHGVAILSVREGLEFDAPVESDTAPLWEPVHALLEAGIAVHCLRDLTRGGLSSALNEIASAARVGMEIFERRVPVREAVRGACEILGSIRCTWRTRAASWRLSPEQDAERALDVLRGLPLCRDAARIGAVTGSPAGMVTLESRIGGRRVLDMLSGEQLPRIC